MNYVVPIITGAIIGYITNWLAIKMLFRPLREKRLLGVRVPFTPGLIPKEKKRIAKSVGNTVGQHLLSPEVLSQALCSPRVISYMRDGVVDRLQSLKNDNSTIGHYMKKLLGQNFCQVDDSLKHGIAEKLDSYFEDRSNRRMLIEAAGKFVYESYYDEKDEAYIKFKEFARKNIRTYTETQEFKGFINRLLDRTLNGLSRSELTLAQALPEELFKGIEEYVYEHDEELAQAIKKGITSFPVRGKLKKAIVSMLEQNLGKLITMFANMDSISEKVINGIEEYLSKPENYREIADVSVKVIASVTQVKINSLSSCIKHMDNSSMETLSEAAITALLEKENVNPLASGEANQAMPYIPQELISLALRLSDGAADYGYIKRVSVIIGNRAVALLWNVEVSKLAGIVDNNMTESLVSGLEGIYTDIMIGKAPQVLDTLNIPEIVEGEIDGFDVEFAEKLITDIAQRELSAITWLGALLGAVMGVVIPVIQGIF